VELLDLECFLAVAAHRHVGRAAEQLHRTQPTVSKALRRLERQVGAPLFDRSRRPLALTPVGEVLHAGVARATRDLGAAFDAARREAERRAGLIRIGYAADLGPTVVAHAIAALPRRHPELQVQWGNAPTAEGVAAVRAGTLDLALGWLPRVDPDLEAQRVGESGFVALVPEGHPLDGGRASIGLAELAAHEVILWPHAPHPELHERIARTLTGAGARVTSTTYGDTDEVNARVVGGHGIGLVPAGYARLRPVPGVVAVPVSDIEPVPLVAVRRRVRPDAPSPMHAALDALTALVAELAPAVDAAVQATASASAEPSGDVSSSNWVR
jgi:DNA-binding transcriptional LysR family regulator